MSISHPDVVVVCGELILAEGRSDTITNPVVIMEVLSESTRDYDRGTKFTAYRSIETLTDYILIDQDTVHIEYFWFPTHVGMNHRFQKVVRFRSFSILSSVWGL